MNYSERSALRFGPLILEVDSEWDSLHILDQWRVDSTQDAKLKICVSTECVTPTTHWIKGSSPPVGWKATSLYFERHDFQIFYRPNYFAVHIRCTVNALYSLAPLQVLLSEFAQKVGGILLHACAGVYQGKGYLVPGRSETGKSTIAHEAGFDQVLSDEAVLLLPNEDQTMTLYGTPFWSEGRRLPLCSMDVKLSTVLIPVQSNQLSLYEIEPIETALALLKSAFSYRESDENRVILFERCCAISSLTKSAGLLFPKKGPWIFMIS